MEEKVSKLRLLTGLLSLVRLREKVLKDPALILSNEDFSHGLKKNFYSIDRDFLEFIYCYLFMHFNDLMVASFLLNSDNSLKIDSLEKAAVGMKYHSDDFELIEDQALPIKRTRKNIIINEDDNHALLSNEVTFFNSKAIEMLKLESREEIIDANLPIDELLDKAGSISRDTVLFRTEDDITEIKEMSKGITKPYEVKKHIITSGNIWDMAPQKDNSYVPVEIDYEVMPSIVSSYLENLKKRKIEKVHDYKLRDKYDNKDLLDEDVLKMVEKIEMNSERPLSSEELTRNRLK